MFLKQRYVIKCKKERILKLVLNDCNKLYINLIIQKILF